MLPSIRALKPAVECASPCPLAAGVSAAVIALSDDMGTGLGCSLHCTAQCSCEGLYSRPECIGYVEFRPQICRIRMDPANLQPKSQPATKKVAQIVTCVPTSTTRPVGIWK